jgi:UDP-N-acetylglucosamine 2-epimerase
MVRIAKEKGYIIDEAFKLIEEDAYYSRMCSVNNPFGDGHAIDRIIEVIKTMDTNKT